MADETYEGWGGPTEAEQGPAEEDPSELLEAQEEGEIQPDVEEKPEAEPEKLYAGKYRSIEALEEGYLNLEKVLGMPKEERVEPTHPDASIISTILTTPASRLAEEEGPWDQWIQELYPAFDPSEPEDWREIKADLKAEARDMQRRQQEKEQQLLTIDQQVTEAFARKYPAVFASSSLMPSVLKITADLWRAIEEGARPFPGPEAFAEEVGSALIAEVSGIGPQAMGAYNAQRARHASVPSSGVTPTDRAQKPFDPEMHKGWKGPKD